jgi:hypothetical protein
MELQRSFINNFNFNYKMVGDHYSITLIKKIRESLEDRSCKIENKIIQDFNFLDNLKLNFCKIGNH